MRDPFVAFVLARVGSAEVAAIIGGVVFILLMGFFLFWGGPPKSERR